MPHQACCPASKYEASDHNLPHISVMDREQGAPIPPALWSALAIRKARDQANASPTPIQTAASSMTPLQDLHGIITPNGLHFEALSCRGPGH